MKKAVLGAAILVFAFLFIAYQAAPVQAEPTLLEVLDHLGFTNTSVAMNETFPAGVYEITLYAEFAGYCDSNELSYYEVGTTTYNLLFAGPEGGFGYLSPPITKTISLENDFGISMLTPEGHRYFTQTGLNPDGKQHSKVFINNDDPSMFLIGFENLYGAGDRDYQDFVFSLKPWTPQHVVPEVPFGTILTVLGMVAGLAGFMKLKKTRS